MASKTAQSEAPDTAATTDATPHEQAPSIEQQMALFLAGLESRQSRFEAAIEARLQGIEDRAPAPSPTVHQSAGLIAPPQAGAPTYIPTPPSPMELEAARNAERIVAFIPKDDPFNPKSRTFDAWCNGVMYRTRRGEVAMLPLGFATDLARGGHGHVVDLVAMQSVTVQTHPDLSTPDSEFPTSYSPNMASSVPPEYYERAG